MRGARSIYVDYVDYDEIGHHAGATRIESLASLRASTRWSRSWRRWRSALRTYHLVLLSDHGQYQGEPFAASTASSSATCAGLTDSQTTGIEGSIEGWGRVDSVLEDLGGTRRRRCSRRPRAASTRFLKPEGSDAEEAELIVLAGGNLGMVYVPGPERLLLEEIEGRWPALIPGLVAHPGVAFVSALSSTGPVAIGERTAGTSRPVWSRVSTRCFPSGSTHRRCWRRPPGWTELPSSTSTALSTSTRWTWRPSNLVGCHGGLGGWQDRGFVLAPLHLLAPSEPIGRRRAAPAPRGHARGAGAPD